MIGPGACDAKEAVNLSCVVRFVVEGVELESDILYGEILVAEPGFDKNSSGLSTPGYRSNFKKDFEDQRPVAGRRLHWRK